MIGIFNNLMFSYEKHYIDNPKAVIIITHGICEHSQRYFPIINHLNNNGYSVIRYDLRGHGQTGGRRGHINSFSDFINDLNAFVLEAKKNNPNTPLFLLGHSMGGLITSLYAIKYENKVDGIILSGAANGNVPGAVLLKIVPWKLLKNKTVRNFFPKNFLSSDDDIEKAYWKDPLILKEYSINLAGQMFSLGVKHIKKNYSLISKPILFLHGESDKIVPVRISRKMFQKVSSEDKAIHIIENAPHEIFNEPNKNETFKIITDWLDSRV